MMANLAGGSLDSSCWLAIKSTMKRLIQAITLLSASCTYAQTPNLTFQWHGQTKGMTDAFVERFGHDLIDPFIRALQLDGNPCKKARGGLRLSHALMFSGSNIGKYFECRPAIPNSKPLLAPGTVPTP